MEVSGRNACRARADRRTNVFRHRRNRRKPLCQGLEIKPRAANKNRQALLAPCLVQRNGSIGQPKPGRMIDRAIDVAKQAMWRLGLVFAIGAGRQHAQIAVDLHRIGVDHHAAEGAG